MVSPSSRARNTRSAKRASGMNITQVMTEASEARYDIVGAGAMESVYTSARNLAKEAANGKRDHRAAGAAVSHEPRAIRGVPPVAERCRARTTSAGQHLHREGLREPP